MKNPDYSLYNQETERLIFRALRPSDFNAWLPLFEADNVAKFLEMDTTLSPREMCQVWFDKSHHRFANNLGVMNVLEDKKSGELMGQCGLLLQTVNNKQRLEIGYSILPVFWERGYASEATQKCKVFAFKNRLANSLISVVHKQNVGSEKVAVRNGMTLERRMGDFNVFSVTSGYKTQEKVTS